MADLASIGAALGSVKTLWDLLKNAQDAQLAMKISVELGNIQGQLIDVQQQTLSIQQENQQLRAQIESYKSFTYHHSVNWKLRPEGTEDGPFCPVCIAASREMRLAVVPRADQTRETWLLYCPQGHQPIKGIQAVSGPFFDVPKSLIPENYFSYVPFKI
jgi:hypothetical protein